MPVGNQQGLIEHILIILEGFPPYLITTTLVTRNDFTSVDI